MKKKHAKQIREITEGIGGLTETIQTWEPISGADLLLTGFGRQPIAKTIIPEHTYEISVPMTIEKSVKKELKRAFKKDGNTGIISFVTNEFNKITDKSVINTS